MSAPPKRDPFNIEEGQAAAGVLDVAVMVVFTPLDETMWHVEVALDLDPSPEAVLFSPDGGVGLLCPLADLPTQRGHARYIAREVDVPSRALIFEVLQSNQQTHGDLCFYVDLTGRRSYRFSRRQGLTGGQAVGWGARGSQGWPQAVGVVGAWSSPQGQLIDLRIDDARELLGVQAVGKPGGSITRARPFLCREGRHAVWMARLRVSAAVAGLDVSIAAAGGPLEELSGFLSLGDLPPMGPGLLYLAPPAELEERWQNLTTPAAPRIDQGTAAEDAPVPERWGRATPIEDSNLAMDPMDMVRQAAENLPIRRLTRHRRQAAAARLRAWPESLGESGPTLGPPGPLTSAGAVRLVSVECVDQTVGIVVQLDDQGLVAAVGLAREGMSLCQAKPDRITNIGCVRVRLEFPEGEGPIVLYCCNRYGEMFPNLIAEIDARGSAFRPFRPDRDIWRPLLDMGEPLDFGNTSCATCQRPLTTGEGTPLLKLRPGERAKLRAQFALTPDALALCSPCFDEYILTSRPLHRLARLFTAQGLETAVVRMMAAYAGALCVNLWEGQFVARQLNFARGLIAEDSVAFTLAGCLMALGSALLPWTSWLTSTRAAWRLRRKGRSRNLLALYLLPGTLMALIGVAYSSFEALPTWYAPSFWYLWVHLAALSAWVLSTPVGAMIAAWIEAETEQRMQVHRPQLQLARAGTVLPELLDAFATVEYERAMDRVLIDGLGALDFQVYQRDPDTGRFRLARHVGAVHYKLMSLEFKEGEPHVMGQAAESGRVLSSVETGKGHLLEAGSVERELPFIVTLPVVSAGQVVEVYNITRLKSMDSLGALAGMLELVCLMAGQALDAALREAARHDH